VDIQNLLPESHILLNLQPQALRQLVHTLAQPLQNDGVLQDIDGFINAILEREARFSTQVADGIAIPHARFENVYRLGLTIGIAQPGGIDFAPNTPGKTKLFFLISTPYHAPEAHLELMASIVNTIMNPDTVQELLAAKTPAEVIAILSR